MKVERKIKMKKLRIIMVVMVGMFLFTACNENYITGRESSKQSIETTISETETERTEETEETKEPKEFVYYEQEYEVENNLFGNQLQRVKYPNELWGTTEENGNYILKNGTQSVNIEELKESIKSKSESGEPLDPLGLSFMAESIINAKFEGIPSYRIKLLYNPEPVFFGPRRLNTDNVEEALPLFRSEQLFEEGYEEGANGSTYYRFKVPETLKNTGRIYDKEGEGKDSYPIEGSNIDFFPDPGIYVINIEQRQFRFFNMDGRYLGSAYSSIRWWEPYDIEVVDGNMAMCYLNGKHQFDITDKDIPSGVVTVSDMIPAPDQYNLVRIFNTDPKAIGYFVGYLPENGREGIMSRDGEVIGTE